MGFDEVYDVSYTCELYNKLIEEYVSKQNELTISSMCPVVVRLIEFKFPHLTHHLFPMESSRGIAAMLAKLEKAKELGLKPEDICAIYITPCPAKMISINQPQCREESYLDAAISISEIYGPLLKVLGNRDKKEDKQIHHSGGIGISWGMIGGEIRGLDPETSLAVEGIHNVINVLEDIEDGKIKGIKYLELRSCTGGCIGGPFTVENQYIARNKIVRLIRKFGRTNKATSADLKKIREEYNFYCDIALGRHSIDILDQDPKQALMKMKKRDKIFKTLPGIDCGACGVPTCKSFAEDVVQGRALISECLLTKEKE
jgi:iron only hydrogenase large subunit-like protein